MSRSEKVVLAVLCMIYEEDKILLQNRLNGDWKGLSFPGGHVEAKESFVQAAVREVKEETGLDIKQLQICGMKHFQNAEKERFVIILFKTNQFFGQLTSSEEGEMQWVEREELLQKNLSEDFMELLQIFDSQDLSEIYYSEEDGKSSFDLY